MKRYLNSYASASAKKNCTTQFDAIENICSIPSGKYLLLLNFCQKVYGLN